MISISIQNNIVALQDIKNIELDSLLSWCNDGKDYRFAIGTDKPVTKEMLEDRLINMASNQNEFFLIIYSFYENKNIGMIIGKLSAKMLWINVLAVAAEFQGKGYGSISIDLLFQYMKQMYKVIIVYLSVADNNIKGHSFWLGNGFCDIKHVKDKVLFDGEKHNVTIMQKQL